MTETDTEKMFTPQKVLNWVWQGARMRNKMAGNDKLEDLLSDVLSSTEKLAELGHQTLAKKD